MHNKSFFHATAMLLILLLLTVSTGFAQTQSGNRERSQIDDKYKWNLADIYSDWAAWEKGLAEMENMMDDYAALQGTLGGGPENLLKAYRLGDDLNRLSALVYRYPYLQYELNARDSEAASRLQRVQTAFARFGTATAWFTPEMLAIGWDTVSKWLAENKGLEPYRFPIENAYRKQKHILTEDKEKLLSYFSLVNANPFNTYSALATADIKYRDITLSDGSTAKVTPGNYRNILVTSGNQADRAKAFDAYYMTYSDNINTYAALYNGILQTDWASAQARNYPSCLAAGLDGYNVPEAVVENLIASVKRGLKPLHRYYQLRKDNLGLKEYHMYDGSYPLVNYHKTYEYDDVVKWLIESVKPLGDAYQAQVKAAFENRWVDVFETPNKATGAFSGDCYGVHPFILMNYNKTLNNALILAHEFGHAMHSVLANTNQPLATADYTLLGAEVASAVNQELFIDYLLKQSKDPLERITILMNAIESLEGVFFRQVHFAEFEVEAHRMVERGEPITAESLSDLCMRISRIYQGETVTSDSLYQYTWARITHYYEVPYYVYQYAASYAAAAQLLKDINSTDSAKRQGGLDRYMAYLKAGGSDHPMELMKKAGADLTKPEAFDAVVDYMDRLVTQLEQELAKI